MTVTKQCECHGCGNVVDVYDAVKAGSFLTYSLENALRELFELQSWEIFSWPM